MKKIVYIHSIKDVPFYVGSGDKKRAYDKIGRSDAWKDIVNSNKNEYDIEIVFSGDIIECLEIENEYIKKYWDTICNYNEVATSASINLKCPSLKDIRIKVGRDVCLARKKRGLSSTVLSKKAEISRATLWKIESGQNTTIDAFVNVLFILGFHNDFANLLSIDKIGDAKVRSKILPNG
jgi:hypothetical protein